MSISRAKGLTPRKGFNINVLQDVTRCTLVDKCQLMEESTSSIFRVQVLSSIMKMESGSYSTAIVPIYQDNRNLHRPNYYCKNVTSYDYD